MMETICRRYALGPFGRLVNRQLLWWFLLLVFFIHYETRLAAGTLHSWILFIGILFVIPQIAYRSYLSHFRVPYDYFIVGLMSLGMLVGYLIRLGESDLLVLQAYVLSLACYVFVRETMPMVSMEGVLKMNALFLIGNSALMLVQFTTGSGYVAKYLLSGDVELMAISGFADGQTKNGMVHAAALSAIFARCAFQKVRPWSLEVLALLMGVGTLLLTASRAGVVAFFVAAALTVLVALRNFGLFRLSLPRVFRGFAVLVIAGAVGFAGLQYATSEDALTPERAESVGGRYSTGVIASKFLPKDDDISTLLDDGSVAHRFVVYEVAFTIVRDRPWALFFGLGFGGFVEMFDLYATDRDLVGTGSGRTHSSWLELLIEGGLIVYVLWLVLMVHVIRGALRREDAVEALPILSALISTMVMMLFHDVLRGRTFWVSLGILGAIAYYPGPIAEMGRRFRRVRSGS